MTDRAIIFSAPMVRALLVGRKTQTRRLAWRYRETTTPDDGEGILRIPTSWQSVRPGDRLWVRETWNNTDTIDGLIAYAATDDWPDHLGRVRWRSPIHMPRSSSRITLTVTDVRVQRVQEISEADARAEGACFHDGRGVGHSGWRHDWSDVHADARSSFARLWDHLHGPGAWDANPWVVALTFTVEQRNIDAEAP